MSNSLSLSSPSRFLPLSLSLSLFLSYSLYLILVSPSTCSFLLPILSSPLLAPRSRLRKENEEAKPVAVAEIKQTRCCWR